MPISHPNLELPPGVRQPIPGGALFNHAEAKKAFEAFCENNGTTLAEQLDLVEAFYQGWHSHEKFMHKRASVSLHEKAKVVAEVISGSSTPQAKPRKF